jgi:hypothetical protein
MYICLFHENAKFCSILHKILHFRNKWGGGGWGGFGVLKKDFETKIKKIKK